MGLLASGVVVSRPYFATDSSLLSIMLTKIIALATALSFVPASSEAPHIEAADWLYVVVDGPIPQDPVRVPVPPPKECHCPASYSEGNLPVINVTCPNGQDTFTILVSPREQKTTNGECDTREDSCITKPRSVCRFTGKVKISYPPSPPCGYTMWVQGGSTFPTPSPINQTEEISLDFTATCDATGDDGGESHRESQEVKIWSFDPTTGTGQLPDPTWSYSVTLTCKKCEEKKDASATTASTTGND